MKIETWVSIATAFVLFLGPFQTKFWEYIFKRFEERKKEKPTLKRGKGEKFLLLLIIFSSAFVLFISPTEIYSLLHHPSQSPNHDAYRIALDVTQIFAVVIMLLMMYIFTLLVKQIAKHTYLITRQQNQAEAIAGIVKDLSAIQLSIEKKQENNKRNNRF